jgi:hypothetical protein
MTKTRVVIAALLVLASASASVAATGRTAPGAGWSNSGGLLPGSQAERDWFERASRPSNL